MDKRIKAAFFDVDWTLYDHHNRRYVPSGIEAIKRLKQKGVMVFVCSARPYESLKQFGVFDLGIAWDGYIACAGALLSDLRETAKAALDTDRADKFARSLARREIGTDQGKGAVYRTYLSAVTPEGYTFFDRTPGLLCEKVIAIEDSYGAAADRILRILYQTAVQAGRQVMICHCPILPDGYIEHLLLPETGVAFCTSTPLHRIHGANRIIHASRFYAGQKLDLHRQKLLFCKKAVRELLRETGEVLTDAKLSHDALERFYIGATDFSRLEPLYKQVCACLMKSDL